MQKNLPLTKVNYESEVNASGFPMMYDDNNLYIDTRLNHSLVIGTIGSGKTIIYIISGNSNNSQNLIPLLISQVYFAKMLDNSISLNIVFTIMIRGFNDLKNVYGKERYEVISSCKTDNELKSYIFKKENEGKLKKVVKIAGLNKLLRMYYVIVKKTYKGLLLYIKC